MRRKLQVRAKHEEFSERTIVRYAWFPRTLDDNYQVWLERYYVRQKYFIWDRKGRWRDQESWSESTEKRRFLLDIKDSENVQDQMDSPKYTLAKQAAGRALKSRNSIYK